MDLYTWPDELYLGDMLDVAKCMRQDCVSLVQLFRGSDRCEAIMILEVYFV